MSEKSDRPECFVDGDNLPAEYRHSGHGRTGAPYSDVDQLLAAARAGLDRLGPDEVVAAVANDARLVDIRPAWQRAREGEISGALIVERNHLEWRLHPSSPARLAQAAPGQRWIVVCSEGYTSSLAAAALQAIGIQATDLIGGVTAWRAAGLPVLDGITRVDQVAGSERLLDLGELGGPDVKDKPAH